MEWDCGDWSGHLYADIANKWPNEWASLEADRFNYRGPNCENYPDMISRSIPFLNELKTHPASSIAIVSHGMIGRVMVATLLGIEGAEMLDFGQANDQVFQISLHEDEVHVQHYVAGEGPYSGLKQAL